MRISIRPVLGFGAGAAAMGFVLIAVATAPRAEPGAQVTAECPDAARESGMPVAADGAQSPA